MRIKNYTNKEYKSKLDTILYPLYWDEGKVFRKGLLQYQYRMYRSWKHNRKTQWKNYI